MTDPADREYGYRYRANNLRRAASHGFIIDDMDAFDQLQAETRAELSEAEANISARDILDELTSPQ